MMVKASEKEERVLSALWTLTFFSSEVGAGVPAVNPCLVKRDLADPSGFKSEL